MKQFNRDLLYCQRSEFLNERAVDQEVEWLHAMLRSVESLDNFCNAHEVIDLNRYRITNNAAFIKRLVRYEVSDRFLFLFNKN